MCKCKSDMNDKGVVQTRQSNTDNSAHPPVPMIIFTTKMVTGKSGKHWVCGNYICWSTTVLIPEWNVHPC